MSSILLRFLMVILMADGVIFTEPDVDVDADADVDVDAEVMLS